MIAMVGTSSLNVSAQQLFMDGDSAEVDVSYDNQSTFTVNIPASLDLSNPTQNAFTADSMFITDNQKVCVYAPTEPIPMVNEYGVNATMSINPNEGGCVATFLRDQNTSDTPIYATFSGLDAGHFTGTATFTIRLMLKDQY